MKVQSEPQIKTYLQLQAVSSGSALRLQTGELLHAQVLTRLSETLVELKLGQRQVKAQTELPLQVGQKLKLEVVQGGEKPVLKLQAETASQLLVQNNMKQVLPRQGSLTTLLANLLQLNQATSNQDHLPKQVVTDTKQLINQLPSKSDIQNGAAIKQAIEDSGILHESRLLKADAAATKRDLKAHLLKLLVSTHIPKSSDRTQSMSSPSRSVPPPLSPHISRTLAMNVLSLFGLPPSQAKATGRVESTYQSYSQPGTLSRVPASTHPSTLKGYSPLMPPTKNAPMQAQRAAAPELMQLPITEQTQDLSRQVEQAVSRIQVNQLAHLEQGGQYLQTELPIRNGEQIDLFQLRLQAEEGSDADHEGHLWTITLAFELDQTGPVYVRVSILGAQISTSFWATESSTLVTLENELSSLQSEIEQQGLALTQINTYLGEPPWQPGAHHAHMVDDQV